MTTKGLPETSHLPIKFIVDVQGVFRKYMSPYIDIIYILISKLKEEIVKSIKILKQFSLKLTNITHEPRMNRNISCDKENRFFLMHMILKC